MKKIFNTWKVSFFAVLLIIIFSLLNIFLDYRLVENILFWVTIVALFIILSNLIFLIIKRKWKQTLVCLIILLVSIASLIIYSYIMFWVYQSRSDKFADNLEIPKDIDLNIPQYFRDSTLRHHPDFEVYASDQPGLYEYAFWISKVDSGTVYLKAFEITQEYQLSRESLIDRSSILVYNHTDSIIRFETEKHFTIYEGDWGKPYAARFELWYKTSKGNSDKKLLEKIYKIEGWQR